MTTSPAPTEAALTDDVWRALAERAIGTSIATLEGRTVEGLTIAPLYERRPETPAQPWRVRRAWSVAQRLDHPDPGIANRLGLDDLEGGADTLVLVGPQSPYARGFGLAPKALSQALDQVELDMIGLRLDAGPGTADLVAALANLVAQRHLASAALAVDIGFDPIGWRARLGRSSGDDAQRLVDLRAEAGLGGTLFLADGRPWHEAGAGEAQELAAVLATAIAYLRRGVALGLSVDEARNTLALLLAADADLFVGLAKFRAMRRLWARIETACELESAHIRLHAETSWRMMTRDDPATNIMRATAATFAAGLGGVDCVTALPFTSVLGLPNDAARRLARNMQRVLLDEAHLAMVVDPTAGAGSFEAVTEALCVEAWSLFQEIERDGGIEHARARNVLTHRIAATARLRADNIASRAFAIIGTSLYADLDAPKADILAEAPCPAADAGPDALPALRDAAPFEALRDQTARASTRPRVFLATEGTPAAFGPSVAEASNFLAAAGIAVVAPSCTRDIDAQLADFGSSGLLVVCLCRPHGSSLKTAEPAARFRAAGARYVIATCRPDDATPAPEIDSFIYDGCNALQTLRAIFAMCDPSAATRPRSYD